MITSILAGFAFTYCLVDFVKNYQSDQRLKEYMKDFKQFK